MSTSSGRNDSIAALEKDDPNTNNANIKTDGNSNDPSAHDFQLDECDDSNTGDGDATFDSTNRGGFITQPDYILNDDDEGNSAGSKESHYYECNGSIHTEAMAAAPNGGNQSGGGGRMMWVRPLDPVEKSPPYQKFSTPEYNDIDCDENMNGKDKRILMHNDIIVSDDGKKDDEGTAFTRKLSSPLRPPREEKSPLKKPPFDFEHSITHVLAGEINQKIGIAPATKGIEEQRKASPSRGKSSQTNGCTQKTSKSEIFAGDKKDSSEKINCNPIHIKNSHNDATVTDVSTSFTKKLSSPLRPPPEEPSPLRRPSFNFEERMTHVLAGEINERLKPRKRNEKRVGGKDYNEHENVEYGVVENSWKEVGGNEKRNSINMEDSGCLEVEQTDGRNQAKSERDAQHDLINAAENIVHQHEQNNESSHQNDENEVTFDASIDCDDHKSKDNLNQNSKGNVGYNPGIDMEQKTQEKEFEERKRNFLHLMDAKLLAIHRASIHLNDNSTSFMYSPRCLGSSVNQVVQRSGTGIENNGKLEDEDLNGGHNAGLPYIGPSLKENYLELRSLLKDGLLGFSETGDECDKEDSRSKEVEGSALRRRTQGNVSALLMGPRGSGKSLVLERCLADLSRMAARQRRFERQQNESKGSFPQLQGDSSNPTPAFRVVRINGMLYQGDNTVTIAREIVRQLNEMSREDGRNQLATMTHKKSKRKKGKMKSSRKKMRAENFEESKLNANDQPLIEHGHNTGHNADTTTLPEEHPCHLEHSRDIYDQNGSGPIYRKSAFTSNIALFDDALRTARLDGIPILIILDDIDTFISRAKNITTSNSGVATLLGGEQSSERQLLLYHLLDRVADHKYLISLVGLTSRLDTYNNLEKRVQSRAEGTTKNLYFSSCMSYDEMVESLLGKFYTPSEQDLEMECLRGEAKAIMLECNMTERGMDLQHFSAKEGAEEINDNSLVRKILKRNFCLGRDIRWFCHVLDMALSFLANDINAAKHHLINSTDYNNNNEIVAPLSPVHFAKAFVATEASLGNVVQSIGLPSIPSQSTSELKRFGEMIGNQKHYALKVGTDPRMRALLDLTEPQIAVLLAARRIMARDDRRSAIEENPLVESRNPLTELAPLTYQRIQDEYNSSFNASSRYTIASYPIHEIRRAFIDLMEIGLVRIKKERSGGGPFQFEHSDVLSLGTDFSNTPIFINHDWQNEFLGPLKAGMLHCSTALRDWGLKIN